MTGGGKGKVSGGRLLRLREVLKRLGDCCTRPPVEVYRGEFGAKIGFLPQILGQRKMGGEWGMSGCQT